MLVDCGSVTKVVDVIGYTLTLEGNLVTLWVRQKAYGQIEYTIGEDGYLCASLTVYGLGDGLRVRILVHGDRLDGTRDARGRTGGGGVGARLDWAALGSAI